MVGNDCISFPAGVAVTCVPLKEIQEKTRAWVGEGEGERENREKKEQ